MTGDFSLWKEKFNLYHLGGVNLKTVSYSSFIIGLLLLGIEYIYLFDDLLGYFITTSGVLLIILGIFINKRVREFLVNIVINFL